MKLNAKALAHASAAWMGAIFIFCRLAVAVFPKAAKAVTQSWFHGIDTARIWSEDQVPGNFLLGFVSAVVLTWLAAYLLAYFYNYFVGKKD